VTPIKFVFILTIGLMIGATQAGAGQPSEPRKLFLIDDNGAFIDASGQVVISASQDRLTDEVRRVSKNLDSFAFRGDARLSVRFEEFSEGLAVAGWALCPRCRNPFWVNGMVDEAGRLVIPPTDSSTRYGNFHEGLATYSAYGATGFINRTGRIVIAARFYEAGDFSEGLAVVRSSEKRRFGYVSQTGELAIPYSFQWAGDFHEGLAAVAFSKAKYGFIDKTGGIVFQNKDWFEAGDFSEGLAAVQVEVIDDSVYRGYRERRYGFIDRTGRLAVPAQFPRARKFSEGLALVRQGPGYGFIDRSGAFVIKPEYADGKSFSEGLAAVAVKTADEKLIWGYLDKGGRWAIKPQFQNANSFSGDLAAVNCDEYGARCRAYIDKTGSVRWPKS
jgi:hypothetical protein